MRPHSRPGGAHIRWRQIHLSAYRIRAGIGPHPCRAGRRNRRASDGGWGKPHHAEAIMQTSYEEAAGGAGRFLALRISGRSAAPRSGRGQALQVRPLLGNAKGRVRRPALRTMAPSVWRSPGGVPGVH